MNWANLFEALMLIAFGASWPAQILKTIRAKNPAGKSFLFAYLIMGGYMCGIASKFISGTWKESGLIYLYFAVLALVLTDTVLCYYYKAKLRNSEAK